MRGLNGSFVVISVSQEGNMDRFIVTLYYGGLHHCEKVRKEADGEVTLWPPHASGQDSRAGHSHHEKIDNALARHCLSMIVLSVKVYRRDTLENLHSQHQQKASDTLPNREVPSHLGHSQDLHRNITGIIFETFPNLAHPYFLWTRLIKSRHRLET